ncbi:sulfatase-like hydrolase/transferase [Paraburkholderia strydomiana]|uniref:sulfatase-like hydrolase/transferase n=1 Tax=Paraburkholderia strydomiana TaxID=1245417 RepID=UPI001BECD9F5|nr:sulfatase-like hydrolase/transferase [Paraburkholderia strydomiana]MBT2792088.1 sulfatase-like hydrolase/transferase [Paraburkholderia strydomiana]
MEEISSFAGSVRNVLFIMCDQLRADHLSCYGAGKGALHTPNIDRIASRGARFERAYVTSAVCGPSRTSYYTGRYPLSHRVTWNRVPMPVDELSLGDYLEQAGRSCWLLGKTHFMPDRLSVKERRWTMPEAARALFDEGGFTPIERYDGHFEPEAGSPYRQYLLDKGYESERPWSDFVIGSRLADGSVTSGWYMRNAGLPAQVRAEDSETAYLTDRAMSFIEARGEDPWVLHLSYIKPHWPYKAPAPYHDLFGSEDCRAPVRAQRERTNGHPVHLAYQQQEESLSFAQDDVWRAIRPVYMGLVKQIDDQIGRLLDHLERLGRLDDTLIIFTSDHGDFLGDHWLGEKEYFFEPAIRVPLLIHDPASAHKGPQVFNEFVECIDIVPTILDAVGIVPPEHRIEGVSLLPLMRHGTSAGWRDYAVGSLDYAYREARQILGRDPAACHGMMIREGRYKYMHWQDYRPQLFDLHDDPDELCDLGRDPALERVRSRMRDALIDWNDKRKTRATETYEQVKQRTHAHERLMNILIGRW